MRCIRFQPVLAFNVVAVVSLALTATLANAAVVFTQVNSPGGPTTPGGAGELMYAPDVSASDLLHGLTGTDSGPGWSAPSARLNDGVHGGSFDQGAGTSGIAWANVGSAVTYDLGFGVNGLGYDITSIQSIAAWQSAVRPLTAGVVFWDRRRDIRPVPWPTLPLPHRAFRRRRGWHEGSCCVVRGRRQGCRMCLQHTACNRPRESNWPGR